MICSDCGREIADNSLSCQYCGKMFVSQRAKDEEIAPAHEQITHLAGQLKNQETATDKAISFRRQQRWFLYGVIVVMFIVGIIMMVNIYSANTKAMTEMANLQVKYSAKEKQLDDVQTQLDEANATLTNKNSTVNDYQEKLSQSTKNLTEMVDKNKRLEEELAVNKLSAETCQANLISATGVNYNLITRLGVVLSAGEMLKIPVALSDSEAMDTDKDGLVDELEKALGTDEIKMDTDADGYDDKAELEKGYNPTGTGAWSTTAANNYRNRVVINKQNDTINAWYVAINGKRYFLGNSANDFNFLLLTPYWKIKQAL